MVADTLSAKTVVDFGVVDYYRLFACFRIGHLGNSFLVIAADDERPAVIVADMFYLHYHQCSSWKKDLPRLTPDARVCTGGSVVYSVSVKIYDVTVPISAEVPIYKGDPGVSLTAFKSISKGDTANVSEITFGVHTGTHVDAPNHFIDGAKRVHELDPQKLIGPCRVVEIYEEIVAIEPEHIGDISGVERILFKTRNSQFWSEPEKGFRTDFTYITPETAIKLVENDVKLVGIDYLSIEKSGSPGHPVHVTLLANEIVILEGIDLREVPPGDYDLICMPLKYIGGGGDGAPARTFLRSS